MRQRATTFDPVWPESQIIDDSKPVHSTCQCMPDPSESACCPPWVLGREIHTQEPKRLRPGIISDLVELITSWGRDQWATGCLAHACLIPCLRAGRSGINVPFCGPRRCSPAMARARCVVRSDG
eukprot:scaffold22093_cov145-Isochrysis_galbana.AAC.9